MIKPAIVIACIVLVFVLGFIAGEDVMSSKTKTPPVQVIQPQPTVFNKDSTIVTAARVQGDLTTSIGPTIHSGDTVVRKIDLRIRPKRITDTIWDTIDGKIKELICPPCPTVDASIALTDGKDGKRSTVMAENGIIISATDVQQSMASIPPPKAFPWSAGTSISYNLIKPATSYGLWVERDFKRLTGGIEVRAGEDNLSGSVRIGFKF